MVSDLGWHCLRVSYKKDARLIWVNMDEHHKPLALYPGVQSLNPSFSSLLDENLSHMTLAVGDMLTHYLVQMPFNGFANRADQDQAAVVRAA